MINFYSLDTGVFTGDRYNGPESGLRVPDGCGCWVGYVDHLSRKLDLSVEPHVLVDHQPPAPPSDEMQTWEWSPQRKRWLSVPTTAARAASARAQRDALLTACDWVVTKSMERGTPIPTAWTAYRQALRDLPETSTFPEQISWPDAPK